MGRTLVGAVERHAAEAGCHTVVLSTGWPMMVPAPFCSTVVIMMHYGTTDPPIGGDDTGRGARVDGNSSTTVAPTVCGMGTAPQRLLPPRVWHAGYELLSRVS